MTKTETKRLLSNIIKDLSSLDKQAELAYQNEGLINKLEHTKYPYMYGYVLEGINSLSEMLKIIEKEL